ncbi:beta-1,3-galactosyltransferase 5-like [Asterias rubens]|uniref:beta-1,3-galactosyltransferase 5-like n=1 Tax=Asterias rubens TaxID=7604 RepID=UPI0014554BF4|nr:beta-1,3-galactosyltransferase 5-like [Asterias rubens]
MESLFEMEFKELENVKTGRERPRNLFIKSSTFDVQPKLDLKGLQNDSVKRNKEDKGEHKIPPQRPLVTERLIKKDTNEHGPLYSDEVINPYPFKLVRSPTECRIVSPPYGNVFLVVLVACRHKEVKDRSLIRRTWGKVKVHKGKSILVRFLVGLPHTLNEENVIQKETAEYGDIIQGDFFDSYKNMTLKVLLGLKWAGLKCPNATYVMNLDSDMFVNVYNLVTLLETSPRVRFAKGVLKASTRPIRKRYSKWYTPVEMYPEPSYPPYLNGPAYVMSGDLPARIFNESVHVRYIPWDDVFIGLVMKRINVTPLAGNHFEDYPNLKHTSEVFNTISNGIATYIRHQRKEEPVFVDIWNNISRSVNPN